MADRLPLDIVEVDGRTWSYLAVDDHGATDVIVFNGQHPTSGQLRILGTAHRTIRKNGAKVTRYAQGSTFWTVRDGWCDGPEALAKAIIREYNAKH